MHTSNQGAVHIFLGFAKFCFLHVGGSLFPVTCSSNLHSDVLCESQSSPKVVLPRKFVGSIAQTKLGSFVECGADAHGWHEFL